MRWLMEIAALGEALDHLVEVLAGQTRPDAAWTIPPAPTKSRPITDARHIDTNTATPKATGPTPATACTPIPMTIPSATPVISCSAR